MDGYPPWFTAKRKSPSRSTSRRSFCRRCSHTGHFMNSVVMIDFEGKPHRTLPKAVDFHPVTSRPIHVDFLRIGEHTKVHVAVPVRFDNEEASPGLKRGGVLNVVQHELELVCDAAQHPERDPHRARRAGDRRFDPHQPGQAARRRHSGEPGRGLHRRHHRRSVGDEGRRGRGRARPTRFRPSKARKPKAKAAKLPKARAKE